MTLRVGLYWARECLYHMHLRSKLLSFYVKVAVSLGVACGSPLPSA